MHRPLRCGRRALGVPPSSLVPCAGRPDWAQRATVPAQKLEPRFHDLVDDAGRPIEHLTFNKGV